MAADDPGFKDPAQWAASTVTVLDDPAEPGSPLESATRSWSLWCADRGIRLTQDEQEDGKRHLKKVLGAKTTRRKGDVTRWKGLVVLLPDLPPRADGAIEVGIPGGVGTDFDETGLMVGLSALVRSGMTSPREADLATVHLTNPPHALCRHCGMLTRNVASRAHVDCAGKAGKGKR